MAWWVIINSWTNLLLFPSFHFSWPIQSTFSFILILLLLLLHPFMVKTLFPAAANSHVLNPRKSGFLRHGAERTNVQFLSSSGTCSRNSYTRYLKFLLRHLEENIAKLFQYFCIVDPRGRPQSRPVVITIFAQSVRQSVRPSVRPKTSISSDNHCRPGLWAGRMDH